MKKTVVSLLVIITLSACSYFKEKEDLTEKWPAERLYAEARGALDSGTYDKAVELYEKLEARFPFGTHGQQAILDLAYAYHKSDEPDAAISTAERFIKLYPENANVDYAYYLKGLTNFQRGKGFIESNLPIDESQRDPASSLQAFQEFSDLVKRYPDSQYAEDAKLRMTHLRNILAEHEIHVARYYMRRNAFVAAANRARYVIERYSRTPSVPDALVIMAKAYKLMELSELSIDALRVLELNYPNHPGLYEVRELLPQ